jgi:hypothetical protein
MLYRIGLCQQRLGQFPQADQTFAAVQQQFAGSDFVLQERQQTLRALVDWSYELLEPQEQVRLHRALRLGLRNARQLMVPRERLAALDKAAKTCNLDLNCYAAAFEWSGEQANEAGHALAALYRTAPAVRRLVDGPLRESGMYVRYQSLSGDELLDHAWADCVHGINRVIDVYGLGKAPRYPAIDSITYDTKSDAWHHIVQNLAATLEDDRASQRR